MIRFVIRRVLLALPTLLAMLTVVFLLARVVPGDPAQVVLGDQATPEALAALRDRLGLDRPLSAQYIDFLGGVLQGDFGTSLTTGRSVVTEVAAVLPYTIDLTLSALFVGVLFGMPLGILAAVRRNAWPDYATRVLSLVGLSFPAFVSGILMLLAFAIQLQWFPVIGAAALDDPAGRIHALVLPALNLGLIMTAYVTRVTRSSMLGVLNADFMRTARAKGVSRRALVWRHALPNALIPVVTVVGLYLGTLIGNSVLTEIVFSRPGLGKLILNAISMRDYTLLQGIMVIFAACVIVANTLTDLVYGLIDPRVKY
ncbi:ABC transporter permease [Azospirillum sp. TSO35-2]|uniref:ABC transporter permease n=1 Tax=Azospirillum sp. TSO35-2 TaxID=716796 RepID=UPI000D619C63|nr:ABC transporter permease [Azospirillum sp. TSO35-2]PWC31048.1 glutathione ABC transporter permease [Azospirillum sp. TSO35-2]